MFEFQEDCNAHQCITISPVSTSYSWTDTQSPFTTSTIEPWFCNGNFLSLLMHRCDATFILSLSCDGGKGANCHPFKEVCSIYKFGYQACIDNYGYIALPGELLSYIEKYKTSLSMHFTNVCIFMA